MMDRQTKWTKICQAMRDRDAGKSWSPTLKSTEPDWLFDEFIRVSTSVELDLDLDQTSILP